MGLDFKGSSVHWTYSGFMTFRVNLAKLVGIDLKAMVGFGGDIEWPQEDDPIHILLNHSDCDGEIASDDCYLVGVRLRELLENSGWDKNLATDNDLEKGLELAEDMIECYRRGRDLVFC